VTGFHQILTAASPGDAVTNAAFEMRALLRRVGPSEIYARHVAVDLLGDVCELRHFPRGSTPDILIHHASIGEPHVHAFLMGRSEPIVLVYHNVTPAHYFERWDPVFASLLELGRREVAQLRGRVAVAIADSHYNARELEEMGYRDVRVIPPVIDVALLRALTPEAGTLNHLDNVIGKPFVLSVGQILPHKRPELLVDAMHIAATFLGCDAYLMIVGHYRLPEFAERLQAKIRELNLPNVHLVGPLRRSELAAMYSRAAALVTASEHEGFCVPPIEAMSFDVPVIARERAAIPETVGDGGLLLPPHTGPALFAEAIKEMIERRPLHDEFARRGRERLAAFDRDRSTRDLIGVLLEVA
jgi:L-malate glycosyltransferase